MVSTKDVADLIDVTHADIGRVPSRRRVRLAGYTTGTPDIRWTSQDWHDNPTATVRIDQGTGTNPLSGNTKDIERGAANIAEAVKWADNRRRLNLHSTFYIDANDLPAAESAVRVAGLEEWVFYWVADWKGMRDEAIRELGGRIVAIQYASPGSFPNLYVPFTRTTIAEANCDLSVCLKSWHPVRVHHRPHIPHIIKRHPRTVKVTVGAGGGAGIAATVSEVLGVKLTPAEASLIGSLVITAVHYLFPRVRLP